MFIIRSESQVTYNVMYFSGHVITRADKTIAVNAAWTDEDRFATKFSQEALADKIADVFRQQVRNVRFDVMYRKD